MRRVLRSILSSLAVATNLALAVACDDAGDACKVDTECGPGLLCRDEICINPNTVTGPGDASSIGDSTPTCSSDGVVCTLATECCSNQCTQNRCGPQPGGNPTCKNQLESCLSTDECCQPYQCNRGLCR